MDKETKEELAESLNCFQFSQQDQLVCCHLITEVTTNNHTTTKLADTEDRTEATYAENVSSDVPTPFETVKVYGAKAQGRCQFTTG
jgi:hypothetical protein